MLLLRALSIKTYPRPDTQGLPRGSQSGWEKTCLTFCFFINETGILLFVFTLNLRTEKGTPYGGAFPYRSLSTPRDNYNGQMRRYMRMLQMNPHLRITTTRTATTMSIEEINEIACTMLSDGRNVAKTKRDQH